MMATADRSVQDEARAYNSEAAPDSLSFRFPRNFSLREVDYAGEVSLYKGSSPFPLGHTECHLTPLSG